VAVTSDKDNIDPIGSCVGQRGSRIQTIISELGGEKIDIIEYSDDPEKYIANSLAPAKIISVELDKNSNQATVIVSEDQLSLAIGKDGQNVRLAAHLTGWKIDILTNSPNILNVSVEDAEEKNEKEIATEEVGAIVAEEEEAPKKKSKSKTKK
jgi:N utilization substance protein A